MKKKKASQPQATGGEGGESKCKNSLPYLKVMLFSSGPSQKESTHDCYFLSLR